MAKRKSPDPAITQRWVVELEQIRLEIEEAESEVNRLSMARPAFGTWQREARDRRWHAQQKLGEAIRAAFADGVLVGPMKIATGLSGSRIYQLKFALRQADSKDHQRVDTAQWLEKYLKARGECLSADVKKAAAAAGITESTLQRTRSYMGVVVKYSKESPPVTTWSLRA
jgi:hypothetical protein